MNESKLTIIEKELIDELFKHEDIIHKRGPDYLVNLKMNNQIEQSMLYFIFKSMNLSIKEVATENHNTMSLVDIWFNNDRISISYELWRALPSNVIRMANSITLTKFIEAISSNETLTKCISESIEQKNKTN